MTDSPLLIAGVIGAARGLRGEVFVEVRTDRAGEVFATGGELFVEGIRGSSKEGAAGAFSVFPTVLTVASAHTHSGRLIVRFNEVDSREKAEALRGIELMVPERLEEDAWYSHQLAGLKAIDPDGLELGIVIGIEAGAAHDLLVVDYRGRKVLVPLVSQIVPLVSIPAGHVVIDAPAGLFELN